MTEEDARHWVTERFGDAATERLERLVAMTIAESARQNLVARSTLGSIWSRHIVDSLQLIAFAPPGRWIDIGTGAGYPGLAIAAADPGRPMVLIEPRRLRAEYLAQAANALGLTNVDVIAAKIEAVHNQGLVISARAVARIATLFASAKHCSRDDTIWLLPKGQNAADEVADAQRTWHGMFHVKQSITNPDSAIVVATGVRRR